MKAIRARFERHCVPGFDTPAGVDIDHVRLFWAILHGDDIINSLWSERRPDLCVALAWGALVVDEAEDCWLADSSGQLYGVWIDGCFVPQEGFVDPLDIRYP